MRNLKTTFADIHEAEKRRHERSNITITCPFCGFKTSYFPWSLAGTGKRCALCGALHTYDCWSYRRKEKAAA